MGGTTLRVTGRTVSEALRNLTAEIDKAEHMGLFVDSAVRLELDLPKLKGAIVHLHT